MTGQEWRRRPALPAPGQESEKMAMPAPGQESWEAAAPVSG
ncbi:hypothetical protein OG767_02650 [Micromonospora sp. NBC_01392]